MDPAFGQSAQTEYRPAWSKVHYVQKGLGQMQRLHFQFS